MKKFKLYLIKKLIQELLKDENVFEGCYQLAYEHGIEKAGYKNNAIPCWDHDNFLQFRDGIFKRIRMSVLLGN